MDTSNAAHALARATATLIGVRDVSGALAALLRSCRDTLEVDAVGVLIHTDGHLDLLAASSHQATELETHQAQLDEGPCVDAYSSGEPVTARGHAELLQRWPEFGQKMFEAGFGSVHASPLRWHHTTIGAMGLFKHSETPFTEEIDTFGQAFADLTTALVVSSDELTVGELTTRLDDALMARIVIEQAKGVLAEQHDLSMAEAYDLLVQSSSDRQEPLRAWATQIVSEAHR